MTGESPDDPWVVRYFHRHPEDDPQETKPGQDFLRSCPPRVRAHLFDVLIAVAKAPPHRFAGGGKWEAMHGNMTGYHEVRAEIARPYASPTRIGLAAIWAIKGIGLGLYRLSGKRCIYPFASAIVVHGVKRGREGGPQPTGSGTPTP